MQGAEPVLLSMLTHDDLHKPSDWWQHDYCNRTKHNLYSDADSDDDDHCSATVSHLQPTRHDNYDLPKCNAEGVIEICHFGKRD
jgi:hypothetical protein